MNHTTLGIVAAIVAAALIVGTVAAETPAAYAKIKIKQGNVKVKCTNRQFNGQVIAFGAGAIGNTATNTVAGNVQTQNCNAGSTASSG